MKKLLLLSLICVFIFSCKKEKGDTGTAGKDGNANVKSENYTAASWTLSGTYWYQDEYSAMNLSGSVLVYIVSGTAMVQIPVTVSDIETYFVVDGNKISFRIRSASGNTSISNPGPLSFKVVAIPPARKNEHPEVNYSDYQQVKKVFDLKD